MKYRIKFKHLPYSQGFTIIEAVVSMAVFSVAVTAIIGAFLSVMQLDEKSRAIRVVEQNARFLSEFITREIRNGSLNFDAYGATLPSLGSSIPAGIADSLALVNSASEQEVVSLSSGVINLEKTGIGSSSLSSSEVTVSNLKFYIKPANNPFVIGGPTEQPKVTFTFTLTSNLNGATSRPANQARITIQTTVSSRQYPL